jgi:hypothetical protein
VSSYSWPPEGGGTGVQVFSTLSAFPAGTYTGELAVAADTGDLYEWNGTMWVLIAGPQVAAMLAPNRRYIDFENGSDSTGNGSLINPWQTLAYAYSQVTDSSQANAYTFFLSGGTNTNTDSGTISALPDVNLFCEYPINVNAALTISGGLSSGPSFTNIIFNQAFNWLINDVNAFTALNIINCTFNNGCNYGNSGGSQAIAELFIYGGNNYFAGATVNFQVIYAYIQGGEFAAGTNFLDANTASEVQLFGCYFAAPISFSGNALVEMAGCFADDNAGYTFTTSTGGSGTPTVYTDASSLSSTVSGPAQINFTDVAQYIEYTPAIPGNWSPPPALVSTALDQLAASKQPLGNYITALTGDGTATGPSGGGSAALTLATVNSNVGSFGSSTSIPSFTVNAKGLVTAASGNVVIAPAGTLTGTTLNSTVVTSSLTSLGTQTAALNMGSHQINNVTNPSSAQDAATKAYVDSAIAGLTWQGPAKAYAASNVPLTGTSLVIDGYTVLNGDLVILGNQTTASQNGEYSASIVGSAYTLTANGLPTVIGDAWLITNGTVYADSAFVATAIVPAAAFIEFAGPTAYTFSAPLNLTGRTVSLNTNGVTNSYLAQMATLTIKGNNTGGTANAADLTVAQVNAILPVFTSTLNGLAPLSGGGTSNFLRADGSWAAPSGASPAFSAIASGTNTTAAMVVGAGASLTFTSTGTINASTLLSGTWAIPGTIGSTTANTGAFTTLAAAATTITSNSVDALAVGANGTTNPVFQVNASTTSVATGVEITGAAAGSGVALAAISSATNEALTISSKGSGVLILQNTSANGSVQIQVSSSARLNITNTTASFTPTISNAAASVRFGFTGAADTGMTTSTEAPDVYFNMAQTRQHGTGALTLQRDFRISGSTHSFIGASTLSTLAALSIDSYAQAGTNATVTNASGLYIPTQAVAGTVTNAYASYLVAPTGAATINAAEFVSDGTNSARFADGTYAINVIAGSSNLQATTISSLTLGTALSVANGGTGQTTYTNGQLLIGNTTGNTLTKTTLTAGTGISITNGGGSITIAASAASYTAPTTQILTASSGTYTTPTSPAPLYLLIEMVAAGGGGGGDSGGTSGTGGNSTFGTSLLSCTGGTGGGNGSGAVGGSGGNSTVTSPAIQIVATSGQYGGSNIGSTNQQGGGMGGQTPFGGGGQGGPFTGNGYSASTNSGGGGGGAGGATTTPGGAGGGAGGYLKAQINTPSSTYSYTVGAFGAGGTGAHNNGGNGANGIIIVREYYQ